MSFPTFVVTLNCRKFDVEKKEREREKEKTNLDFIEKSFFFFYILFSRVMVYAFYVPIYY